MKKTFFLLFFAMIFSTCGNKKTYLINFLLSNTNDFNEKADLEIYVDSQLVNLDTLSCSKIADRYTIRPIEVSLGRHSIMVKSSMHNLSKEIALELTSDTSVIVEYHHNYSIDTLNKIPNEHPLISGGKDIILIPR